MVDTSRTLSDLQALFADNSTGDISAQDARDALVSAISTTRINAAQYGVLPSNSATENSTALIAMRDYMLSNNDKTYYIYFEPGTYLYDNNRWLWNVKSYIIDAYGCTFQNTLSNAWEQNGRPINTNDVFDDRGDVLRSVASDNYVVGNYFNSAVAGDLSVTTTTAGDSDNFAVGDRVLLYGYDTQFAGYPHNPRFFEYKEVLTSAAGVVTFTDMLEFDYDSTWPESNIGFGLVGKPLILNLDRTNYIQAKLAVMRGATFLPNSVNPAFREFHLIGDTVVLEDITAPNIPPTTSKNVFLIRCKTSNTLEIDKVINTVVLDGCEVKNGDSDHSLGSSTGAMRVIARNTKFYGPVHARPRSLDFDNCDFYVASTPDMSGFIKQNGGWGIRSLTLKGNTFYNMPNGETVPRAVNSGVLQSITVGSVSGTDILIAFDATAKTVAGSLDVGSRLELSGGLNSGIVTGITHDGGTPGNLIISGTWTTPVVSEVYNYRLIENIIDLGGNLIRGTDIPMYRNPEWVRGNYHSIWVPAAQMVPSVTAGCAALATVELTAGQPDLTVLDFDATADEHAQFNLTFPNNWDKGTIEFQAYWTVAAGVSTGVAIGLQARQMNDDTFMGAAFSSPIVVTDNAHSNTNDLSITARSASITIPGETGENRLVFFRVFRDVSDANDDMTQDMRLIGLKIFWTSVPDYRA